MSRFDYLRQHPDEARIFDAMMANYPDNRHAAIAEGYDFSGAGLIADIGGGNGATLRHILTRFPTVRGLASTARTWSTPFCPRTRCRGGFPCKPAASSMPGRVGPTSTC